MSQQQQFATVSQGSLKVFEFSAGSTDGCAATVASQSSSAFKGTLLSCLAWNHTNQVLAVAGNKPQISLVQANNGQLLSTIPFTAEQAFVGPIQALAFSSNSRYLASGNGRFVHLWDLKRRALKGYLGEHQGAVTALGLSQEGDVVAGDDAGCLRVWDIKLNSHTDMPLSAAAGVATAPSVTCLQLSYLGPPRVASGYTDGTLALWDYPTRTLLRRQTVHPTGQLTGLAYSPKNARLVATCGGDGRVTLNDTGSKPGGPPSASIVVGDHLTCISFHEDAIHCCVGTNAGYALVYDWRNVRKPVAKVDAHLPYPVTAIAFQLARLPQGAAAAADDASGSSTPARKPDRSSREALIAPAAASSPARPEPPLPLPISMPPSITSNIGTSSPAISASQRTARPGPLLSAESSLSSLSVGSSLDLGVAASASASAAAFVSALHDKSDRQDKGRGLSSLSPIVSAASSLASQQQQGPADKAGAADRPDVRTSGSSVPLRTAPAPAPTPTSTPAPAPAPAPFAVPPHESPRPAAPAAAAASSSTTIATTATARYPPAAVSPETDALRRAMLPVTVSELSEALQLLRYDVHKEIAAVTREQVRQFALAKVRTPGFICPSSLSISSHLISFFSSFLSLFLSDPSPHLPSHPIPLSAHRTTLPIWSGR